MTDGIGRRCVAHPRWRHVPPGGLGAIRVSGAVLLVGLVAIRVSGAVLLVGSVLLADGIPYVGRFLVTLSASKCRSAPRRCAAAVRSWPRASASCDGPRR